MPYSLFALTLSRRSKFSWVTFHVSSTLICQFLLVSQFIERSTTKIVFLCCWSQRKVHLFCTLRMTFTWTESIEKSSYHDPDFLGYCQKWVKLVFRAYDGLRFIGSLAVSLTGLASAVSLLFPLPNSALSYPPLPPSPPPPSPLLIMYSVPYVGLFFAWGFWISSFWLLQSIFCFSFLAPYHFPPPPPPRSPLPPPPPPPFLPPLTPLTRPIYLPLCIIRYSLDFKKPFSSDLNARVIPSEYRLSRFVWSVLKKMKVFAQWNILIYWAASSCFAVFTRETVVPSSFMFRIFQMMTFTSSSHQMCKHKGMKFTRCHCLIKSLQLISSYRKYL